MILNHDTGETEVELTRFNCINPQCHRALWTDDRMNVCRSCMPEPVFTYPDHHLKLFTLLNSGMTFQKAVDHISATL